MSAPTNDLFREARVRAAMRSGMTELAAQELADKLERPHSDLEEAVAIIGDLIDWFGTPDWAGPTLPDDLGQRIADLMERVGSTSTPMETAT